MWFKNLQIYTLPADWQATADQVEEAVAKHPLLPVNQASMQSHGWVPPAAGTGLAYRQGKHMLIALGIEQRILPGSVINDEVKKKAAELEKEQGFAPGRKQLRDLKDRVMDELRPRAFIRKRTVRAWLDFERRYFVIDSSSPRVAEDLCTVLRADLGDLPAVPMDTRQTPAAGMTGWVATGESPPFFALQDTCELVADNIAKSNVRYQRHELDGPEIRSLISGGKTVARLGMVWHERVSMVLTDKAEVKRVRFVDVDEVSTTTRPDADEFDADFTLMTGEIANLIGDLIGALGGPRQP
ncbi:recombination-associated protein RdgC [Nevskia sp.]|uniref:recombination-associated protein RdgC n=1 Tax=Nevskia sp. TaxID=1929292 RepID=UPI0025D055B6|nr:recombination-associated protein RdgC [Nevskia sp.]